MSAPEADGIRQRTAALLTRVARRPLEITDSSTLIGDLALEWIQLLELVGALELEFDIVIEDDAEPVETFADLVAAIETALAAPG